MRLDLIVRNRINNAKYAKTEMELRKILSDIVNALNTAMEKRYDSALTQARIAIKGIRQIAKMNNSMAYVCGQYDALIDHMINIHRSNIHMDSVNEIMGSETSQAIAKYLLKNGCSLRNAVGCHIGISKNLFDVCMDTLIKLGIIRQDVGPECEWVELSSEGYAYMRMHYFEKEGFKIW